MPFGTRVKIEWVCTSILLYPFMACTGAALTGAQSSKNPALCYLSVCLSMYLQYSINLRLNYAHNYTNQSLSSLVPAFLYLNHPFPCNWQWRKQIPLICCTSLPIYLQNTKKHNTEDHSLPLSYQLELSKSCSWKSINKQTEKAHTTKSLKWLFLPIKLVKKINHNKTEIIWKPLHRLAVGNQ